jgi:hypothetical protein
MHHHAHKHYMHNNNRWHRLVTDNYFGKPRVIVKCIAEHTDNTELQPEYKRDKAKFAQYYRTVKGRAQHAMISASGFYSDDAADLPPADLPPAGSSARQFESDLNKVVGVLNNMGGTVNAFVNGIAPRVEAVEEAVVRHDIDINNLHVRVQALETTAQSGENAQEENQEEGQGEADIAGGPEGDADDDVASVMQNYEAGELKFSSPILMHTCVLHALMTSCICLYLSQTRRRRCGGRREGG